MIFARKLCLWMFLLLGVSVAGAREVGVSSPDGTIRVRFYTNPEGAMFYSILQDNKVILDASQMGFVCRDGVDFSRHFAIQDVIFEHNHYRWTQPWGENKNIDCNYEQMTVKLKNDAKEQMDIEFRVFDDGVGFRYRCFADGQDSLVVMDEKTQFNVATHGMAWHTPAHFDTYELAYLKEPIGQVQNANTPMTCKTDNGYYFSVHEAALTNFADMTLKRVNGVLKAELAPLPDGAKARFAANHFVTPWRTVIMGRQAVDLINSALILNLNEPCKVKGDLAWCKPMKYIGIWWGMHLGVDTWAMDDRHGATTANAMRYIDFAARHHIQGVVFEGWNKGWETWGTNQNFDFTAPYPDFDIRKIVNHAAKKGIQIIGHHETGGHIANYERQLDKAYQWYADMGIHYVKTGYAGGVPNGISHHSQLMVNHYRKVVETAARYRVCLDVHEPIKPTGIRRTYPNMMTREGARGMEWNAWSEGNSATHTMTLPFTRLLAGPMDYTPGTFDILFESTKNSPRRKKWNDLDKGNSRVHTTLARQIADWVILYSPLQMASDRIESYEHHPAFRFFEDFDADCDWSEALQGEVGEYVAIVRKAKQQYFLGVGTNEQKRTLTIPLSFLEKGKKYQTTIYADAADADYETNPTAYVITRKTVDATQSLVVDMARGGGQAVVFKPVK